MKKNGKRGIYQGGEGGRGEVGVTRAGKEGFRGEGKGQVSDYCLRDVLYIRTRFDQGIISLPSPKDTK